MSSCFVLQLLSNSSKNPEMVTFPGLICFDNYFIQGYNDSGLKLVIKADKSFI